MIVGNLPGGELAARPLHVFILADGSGSMQGAKIQALNNALRNAVPALVRVADENPTAEVLLRVIQFGSGAQWHVPTPVPVAQFTWTDMTAGGSTDMGQALRMVADQLKVPPMSRRAVPPVLVLVSDGQPTDDFDGGLRALMDEPWGRAAVRVAIAIGSDVDTDVLTRFVGNPELPVLNAHNPEELTHHIRWASTEAVRKASRAIFLPTDPSGSQSSTQAPNDIW